ncbi:conserved hypothetical protein [Clostridium neonatale]|uniref:hypothetical protein n=1 Tax=Clostridium neonatale TaxID=137838 RepID=UPI00291B55D9|nr:hypothetical protein [Clostridium neonatale]CAI3539565.1 conserved hypothetical protein [Clostridium neonatale]CAI3606538.1 conserved hypothetical protein [Clostridium neonatale]
MNTYMPDSSGINSLGGFSYQIRVFVYYMSLLKKEGMQIEFETIDDVNIREINADNIDENNENFINNVQGLNSNIAIQVKRTKVTPDVAKKVLLNWILLEISDNKVDKYILATDEYYNNEDILFSKTAEELFTEIKESKKNKKSIITKVKNSFNNDLERFIKIYNIIKNKYEFIAFENIDKKIDESYNVLFRKQGINQVVYYNRLKELLTHITVQIMEAVNNRKSYIFTFENLMSVIENICLRISEKETIPLYSDFKKMHKIDFKDLGVSSSREYKQLISCDLSDYLIEQHLMYCGYYQNLRMSYLETNRLDKVEDIEETTFENFQNVKFKLQRSGQDIPYNRLEETKQQDNSFASSAQIKYGSSIYLTRDKDDEYDKQISWKDENNEEN